MVRTKAYLIFIALLAVTLATGCAAEMVDEASMQPVAYDMMAAEESMDSEGQRASSAVPDTGEMGIPAIERLIIRNASLDIVVLDTDAVVDQVSALVDEFGGYIVDSNRYQYQEGLRATVTLRIPVEKLDEVLDRIRDMATEIRSESISGQDVTEEYIDLESRLRHLESTEERLEAFLDEAEDTEAALAVYEQLQIVQADIEQVKGRMKYLEDSAAMSSVTVSITPDELAQPIEIGRWHPEGALRDAFESLIRVLQFLVEAFIYIVVLILPVVIAIAIPIVVVVLILRTLLKGRKKRKAKAAAAQVEMAVPAAPESDES